MVEPRYWSSQIIIRNQGATTPTCLTRELSTPRHVPIWLCLSTKTKHGWSQPELEWWKRVHVPIKFGKTQRLPVILLQYIMFNLPQRGRAEIWNFNMRVNKCDFPILVKFSRLPWNLRIFVSLLEWVSQIPSFHRPEIATSFWKSLLGKLERPNCQPTISKTKKLLVLALAWAPYSRQHLWKHHQTITLQPFKLRGIPSRMEGIDDENSGLGIDLLEFTLLMSRSSPNGNLWTIPTLISSEKRKGLLQHWFPPASGHHISAQGSIWQERHTAVRLVQGHVLVEL